MFKLISAKQDQHLMRKFYNQFLRNGSSNIVYFNTPHVAVGVSTSEVYTNQPRMRPVPMTEEQRTEVLRRTGSKVFHERTFVRAK